MDNIILTDFLTLTAIALTAALILYFVSQKFKVDEDPRIADIEAMLPQANCGACGRAGCHDFAVACTKCTPQVCQIILSVGGQKVMNKVAAYLGMEAAVKEDTIAVLRCNGSCQTLRPKLITTASNSAGLPTRFQADKAAVRTAACVWETVSKFASSVP